MADETTKTGLVVQRKWTGTQPPPQVEQALARQHMGYDRAFAPGRPINPFDGGGGPARAHDYQTGYNIASRPLRDGRISFDTLKGIIDAWALARVCIQHRIDDVRSLDWSIEAAPGVTEDVSTACEYARRKMLRPEGPGSNLPYRAWVAKYLEDVLRYDAGTLYKRRDRADRVIGLRVISGRTIAPLLDYYGDTPMAPAPAYAQFAQGVPWQWFTTEELIYVPFRPQPDSPYGYAPLESILLTANTDLRMQQFFLQRFTSNTVPEGFATAPADLSSPNQIEEWQQYYDAMLYGDTEALHQLKWVPNGTQFEWSKDFKFEKDFQLYLMGMTAAAFGVTLNDLGFTDDVNRSTGETQTEVQFRVGTLPLVQHLEDIVCSYLQDDLGLPVAFRIDTGQEKDDRLAESQTWKNYIEAGMASPDEGREKILGLPIDASRPVGRYVMHSRRGPIPLLDIVSAQGSIDPETFAPTRDQPLLPDPVDVVAVMPEEGTSGAKASLASTEARQEAARQALHPGVAPHPPVAQLAAQNAARSAAAEPSVSPVGDAIQAALTAGVTAGTGITGNPLHTVRKAATVAGLAVKASDTGRVLMLQRALTDDDPAAGRLEFPGGHLEDGESLIEGACREWAEEVGCPPPPGVQDGSWVTPNGVYQGIVWVIPAESDLAINLDPEARTVLNPDDPDHDQVETVMWMDPDLLRDNPAVRDELAATLDTILPVIDAASMDQEIRKDLRRWRDNARNRARQGRWMRRFDSAVIPGPVADYVWARLDGATTRQDVDAAFTSVVKAKPGKSWRDGAATPQKEYDVRIADYWTPRIQAAIGALWSDNALGLAATAGTTAILPTPDTGALETALRGLWADSWMTGVHGAQIQIGRIAKSETYLIDSGAYHGPTDLQVQRVRKDEGDGINWDSWEPGDVNAAIATADGGLAELLAQAGVAINGIIGTALDDMGNRISDGLLNGDSVDTIARTLRGMLGGDADRALRVAVTETARAQETAAVAGMAEDGIGLWDWVLSDGACQSCQAKAAAGPYPTSGGALIPDHCFCRCSSSPRASSVADAETVAKSGLVQPARPRESLTAIARMMRESPQSGVHRGTGSRRIVAASDPGIPG